jgi:hypothetical protein
VIVRQGCVGKECKDCEAFNGGNEPKHSEMKYTGDPSLKCDKKCSKKDEVCPSGCIGFDDCIGDGWFAIGETHLGIQIKGTGHGDGTFAVHCDDGKWRRDEKQNVG